MGIFSVDTNGFFCLPWLCSASKRKQIERGSSFQWLVNNQQNCKLGSNCRIFIAEEDGARLTRGSQGACSTYSYKMQSFLSVNGAI